MGVNPHALFSCLVDDLRDSISLSASLKIESGEDMWYGITYRERAAASISRSFLKKWEASMDDDTRQRALSKFLQVDETCRNWVSKKDQKFGDDYLLGEFKYFLHKFWSPDNRSPLVDSDLTVLHSGGVGPGAAIGSPGGDFYSKLFSGRLSCTSPTLYFWYRAYIKSFPTWLSAELFREAKLGPVDVVPGNRLSFVPKNDEISRSICTEPTLNQFFQIGFGRILEKRLSEFAGINLATQQVKNRELARLGSRTDQYSTIDLSSASDSIAINMLREYLPRDFYRFLEKYRSPFTLLPDGRLHACNMVSTMGNGYTFPLQTVLFTCIVLSAFRMDGLAPIFPRGNRLGNFGVNGDDIVVPKRITSKVLRLLHLLGFSVNRDKTFVEGPFRESCGGDYFNGRNLRGVYVKRLSAPQDLYSVINQLNLFSTKTDIPLRRTVQYLANKVKYLPVPPWENEDAGIKVPFAVVKGKLGLDKAVQNIIYYAWVPTNPPSITIADVLYVPRSFKPRIFNPDGLWISFLQGSVNDCTIPLIPKRVKYRRKPRIAIHWSSTFSPKELLEPESSNALTVRLLDSSRLFQWRWETATYKNLFL